jgi:hypothetical protein
LTAEHRLIRAQMAAFCRVNPLFPRSVDLLCEEIARSAFSRCELGCEGRGLLELLGHEPPARLDAQRTALLTSYRHAMAAWCAGEAPGDAWEARVWGALGAPGAAKRAHVETLLAAVDPAEPSIVALRETSQALCGATQGAAAFEAPGRPWHCFASLGDVAIVPLCGCSYGLLIDAALLCIGALDGRDPTAATGRFTQEGVLAYCLALNTWLLGVAPRPVAAFIETHYVSGELAERLAANVHVALGASNAAKVWLAACLLKTLKSNQRWHPHRELIDDFPVATSRLAE